MERKLLMNVNFKSYLLSLNILICSVGLIQPSKVELLNLVAQSASRIRLAPHGLQDASFHVLSPSPAVCSNSYLSIESVTWALLKFGDG